MPDVLPDIDDPEEPLIRQGRRVECYKHGPHDGMRGKVVSTWGTVAQVAFPTSTLVADKRYFEPVGEDGDLA